MNANVLGLSLLVSLLASACSNPSSLHSMPPGTNDGGNESGVSTEGGPAPAEAGPSACGPGAASAFEGGAPNPNRLVSAPAFPFRTLQYATGWLGDYFEPAIAGGKIYALWSDGRESDQSHAFFAKASLP